MSAYAVLGVPMPICPKVSEVGQAEWSAHTDHVSLL